jgi:hypothetical protein
MWAVLTRLVQPKHASLTLYAEGKRTRRAALATTWTGSPFNFARDFAISNRRSFEHFIKKRHRAPANSRLSERAGIRSRQGIQGQTDSMGALLRLVISGKKARKPGVCDFPPIDGTGRPRV